MMLKRTTIFLGEGQISSLDSIARKEGVSVAELIRWAIERYRADYRGSLAVPLVPPKEKRVRRGRHPKKGGKS
jgi:hypothetical protein